jgi:hypothetical protein
MNSSQSSFDGAKWSDGYEVPAPGRSAQLRTVGADRESRQIRRALDNDASRAGPRRGGTSLPLSRSSSDLVPDGLAALPDELYHSAVAKFGEGNIVPSSLPIATT